MTDETVARRMSELAAGLREAVSPPDQWEVRFETTDLGSEGKPRESLVVHFTRKMPDGQVLHMQDCVSPQLLEYSVVTPKQIGVYLAERWCREADAKMPVLTNPSPEP